MRRLLTANLKRLWKSVWFWLCFLATVGWSLFGFYCECYNSGVFENGFGCGAADSTIFEVIDVSIFIIPVFVCMFIGEEYSNKIMRNKIIVGHSKTSVYLSNFIVCAIGALIMYATHFVIFTIGGIPIIGPFEYPKETLLCFLCSMFGVVAEVAMFVFISMLITSKSVSLIIAVLMAYFMLHSVIQSENRLNAPATIEDVEYDYDKGEIIGTKIIENPYYLENKYVRQACEFYICFVPEGQFNAYMTIDFKGLPENIALFPVYSIMYGSIFTCGGVLLFRRKDLK